MVNKYPLVSIVINTRNRCKILPRAIESALNQTYKNIEVVIVDAASTDETPAVVKSYSDPRINYIRQDVNVSAAQSYNYGMKMSNGEYIALLDDDDEFFPEKIEKQLKVFLEDNEKKIGLVYCWEEFWNDKLNQQMYLNKPTKKGYIFDDLLARSCIAGTTLMMIRKEVFEKVGGWDDTINLGADYQWAIKIAKYFEIDFVPEVLERTHHFHIYNRMSELKTDNLELNDLIIYHEKILSENKADFDLNPKARLWHYETIMKCYGKSSNHKMFWKMVFKIGLMPGSITKRFNAIAHGFKKYLLKK